MKSILLLSSLQNFEKKFKDLIPNLEAKNVLCITTAAAGEGYPEWMASEIKPLKDQVKSFVEFDLANKNPDEVLSALRNIDIVYVMGGNTYYLLEHIKKSGFKGILEKKLEDGVFYIGVSAGAAVACSRIDYIEDLDDPSKANLDDYEALNFIDFLVMPHINDPVYGPKMVKIIDKLKAGEETLIGITEEQGVLIEGKFMKVIENV
jgi:dipeptidase E